MSRRPKDIGTEGETATVRYAISNGFEKARRVVLAGSHDLGDVSLGDDVPVTVEVKWGKAAEAASPAQIDDWLEETEVERRNNAHDIGVLIVKRKGFGKDRLGDCWAYLTLDTATWLCVKDDAPEVPAFAVRMLAADAFHLLRWSGYGWPLPTETAA